MWRTAVRERGLKSTLALYTHDVACPLHSHPSCLSAQQCLHCKRTHSLAAESPRAQGLRLYSGAQRVQAGPVVLCTHTHVSPVGDAAQALACPLHAHRPVTCK